MSKIWETAGGTWLLQGVRNGRDIVFHPPSCRSEMEGELRFDYMDAFADGELDYIGDINVDPKLEGVFLNQINDPTNEGSE